VIVYSRDFGLSDWVRGLCDQLAENGVIAIAPDLLSGQTFSDPDAPGKRSRAYRNRKSRQTSTLRQISAENPRGQWHPGGMRIFVGRRFGSSNTPNMNPKLKAAYSFYVPRRMRRPKVANIACLVYGFYAGNDERVNATIPTAQELMKRAGKKIRAGGVRWRWTWIHARKARSQMRMRGTGTRAMKHGHVGRHCLDNYPEKRRAALR